MEQLHVDCGAMPRTALVVRLGLVRVSLSLAVAIGVAGCASPLPPPPQGEVVVPLAPGRWLGSGGCAAMGCHNANGFQGEPRSEYNTWVSHDRHARAYEVLFNDRSRTITANLDPKKPAHENAVCLNCHVHKDYEKEQANHHARFAKQDGVGCESCHGPARDWVGDHYKSGWSAKTAEQKLKLGMQDTRSLAGRVRSCTPCHVGAQGMDVNHDLIAAGHPRLAFDFSAYHALMPHHWKDDKDRERRPDWDAVAWFVGDVLTTAAAMELLAGRAQHGVWPEFAEYDCYACHHPLQAKTWRQDKGRFNGRKLGSLPWSDWYSASLAALFAQGKGNAQEVSKLLATLRTALEDKNAERTAVGSQAEKTAAALHIVAQQFQAVPDMTPDVEVVFRALAKRGATVEAKSWDDAARNYLALVALHQAWPKDRGRPDIGGTLTGIRKNLQFDNASDSPPTMYTPQSLLGPYRLLRERIGPKQ
jgi:hypothetical protein